jgi:FixJ family two-component response regulator
MSASVYIVDDDAGLRESLHALLECYDFKVEEHASGDSFISHYRNGGKGCLILDLHMPTPDGLQVIRELRGPMKSDLPVILITGRDSKGLRERALAAGADSFMAKPLDVDQLLGTINSLIARH